MFVERLKGTHTWDREAFDEEDRRYHFRYTAIGSLDNL